MARIGGSVDGRSGSRTGGGDEGGRTAGGGSRGGTTGDATSFFAPHLRQNFTASPPSQPHLEQIMAVPY